GSTTSCQAINMSSISASKQNLTKAVTAWENVKAEIQQKLHDLEFQSQQEFDLDQIMKQLDNIIASKEKFEDSTTFIEDRTVSSSSHQRSSSRSPSVSRRSRSPSRCCFCESERHRSTRCTLQAPV
ncbi:hypothetical protein V3C99_003217, partial [Haemonchus contortus]